jgi:hypothetical protein
MYDWGHSRKYMQSQSYSARVLLQCASTTPQCEQPRDAMREIEKSAYRMVCDNVLVFSCQVTSDSASDSNRDVN